MLIFNSNQGCMDVIAPKYADYNVSDAFLVAKITRSLDGSGVPELLSIEANDHNIRPYYFTIPTTALYKMHGGLLSVLAENGLVINDRYELLVKDYLDDCYRNCKAQGRIEYCHSHLGWFDCGGELVYLHESNRLSSGIVSTSNRKGFGFQRGVRADYEKFLKEKIYTHPRLSLAMALGYSAVLYSYLKDDYDTGEAVIVNLCGASSTGKTTSSQLLVTPFGSPDIANKNSLVRTFHSTTNALFASLDGINGVPIVLDDITTTPNINIPNLIYTLASGEEKSRCNSNGEVRDTGSWSGLIVISSETPIEDNTLQNQGLKVRVLNTEGITWTLDAKMAEDIKRFIRQNYGFTGKDFANYVASLDMDYIHNKFDDARDLVHGLMVKRDKLSGRLETKYAVIALTIQLMNEYFGLSLDATELMTIMIEPEQNGFEERDISKRALEHIKDFIITKRQHFFERKQRGNAWEERPNVGDNYGTIKRTLEGADVYISTQRVDAILKANGILEFATVKAQWKANGITKCDTDRLDCKHLKRRCIHFVFDCGVLLDDDTLADTAPTPTATQSNITSPTPPVDTTDWKDDEAIRDTFEEGSGK